MLALNSALRVAPVAPGVALVVPGPIWRCSHGARWWGIVAVRGSRWPGQIWVLAGLRPDLADRQLLVVVLLVDVG